MIAGVERVAESIGSLEGDDRLLESGRTTGVCGCGVDSSGRLVSVQTATLFTGLGSV